MFKQILSTAFFLSIGFFAMAQDPDSLVRKKADTIIATPKKINLDTAAHRFTPKIKKEKVYHPDSTHIPGLAVKRSLIIPGWGQLYNRRGAWWKIPAIYAGLGALGYSIVQSQKGYKMFLALYRIRNTGGIPTAGQPFYAEYIKYKAEYDLYSTSPLSSLQEAASNDQRNFQISILSVIAVWGVQAVEAYIEAKFINSFTVDNDLSMKVTPSLINQSAYAMSNASNAYIPGIKITFTLK